MRKIFYLLSLLPGLVDSRSPKQPAKLTQVTQTTSPESWDQYNTEFDLVKVTKKNSRGKEYNVTATSYTHYFIETHDLEPHLNTACKRMVQFGASTGSFMRNYKEENWNLVGYDYSSERFLKKNGITARTVDLNAMKGDKLSYESQLREDIAKPSNIFLIRILEYLTPEALHALIVNLILHSAEGSTFFITTHEALVKPNLLASYLAPREDMAFLEMLTSYKDQVLVVQKTKSIRCAEPSIKSELEPEETPRTTVRPK